MPASRFHSHYSLLKVDSRANAQQIKEAYSKYFGESTNVHIECMKFEVFPFQNIGKVALSLHPDRNQGCKVRNGRKAALCFSSHSHILVPSSHMLL